MEKEYSLQDVADMLGMSRNTLLAWQKSGKIPTYPTEPEHQSAKHLTRDDLKTIAKAAAESYRSGDWRSAKANYGYEKREGEWRAELLASNTLEALGEFRSLIDEGWLLSDLTISVLLTEAQRMPYSDEHALQIFNLVGVDRNKKWVCATATEATSATA